MKQGGARRLWLELGQPLCDRVRSQEKCWDTSLGAWQPGAAVTATSETGSLRVRHPAGWTLSCIINRF